MISFTRTNLNSLVLCINLLFAGGICADTLWWQEHPNQISDREKIELEVSYQVSSQKDLVVSLFESDWSYITSKTVTVSGDNAARISFNTPESMRRSHIQTKASLRPVGGGWQSNTHEVFGEIQIAGGVISDEVNKITFNSSLVSGKKTRFSLSYSAKKSGSITVTLYDTQNNWRWIAEQTLSAAKGVNTLTSEIRLPSHLRTGKGYAIIARLLDDSEHYRNALSEKTLYDISVHQANQPNVVLMYIDDLDFDEISPYLDTDFPSVSGAHKTGHSLPENGPDFQTHNKVHTPSIQSLADNGMTLNNFYVTSAVCTPSRYSLLTGRYASRAKEGLPSAGRPTNIFFNTNLEKGEITLATLFKNNGYKTGVVGKWHLVPHSESGPMFYSGSPYDDPRSTQVDAKIKRAYRYAVNYVKENHHFDFVDGFYFENPKQMKLPKAIIPPADNMEWQTDAALRFIEENKDQPFFLYASLTAPHGRINTRYLDQGNGPSYTPNGIVNYPNPLPSRASTWERAQAAGVNNRNAAMATWLDDSVGAILAKLRHYALEDNTVVLFISDHQSRGKLTNYEGARVPAIIKWPDRIAKGSISHALSANIDIPATLVDLVGLQVPDTWKHDGKSMRMVLLNNDNHLRNNLMLEVGYSRAVINANGYKYIAVRIPEYEKTKIVNAGKWGLHDWAASIYNWSWNYKLKRSVEATRYESQWWFPHFFDDDQVYNVKNDIYEQRNLYGKEGYHKITQDLKWELRQLLEDTPQIFGEFKTNL